MMKNIIRNSCIALASVCLCASCDFLHEENKSNVTNKDFFHSLGDLKMSVPGVVLQFNGAFNQTWGATYGGDDMTSKNSGNKIGFHDVDVFAENSSNDRIVNWWKYFYSTINAANAVIINSENNGLGKTKEESCLLGVSYFYRAMSYFFLVRTWGDIPLVLSIEKDKNRPNVPVKDIYAQILKDMEKAESTLPDTWKIEEFKKDPYFHDNVNILPTAGAAKAALANIYLTMAGWPLKQTEMYAKAAQKAKEVIDGKDKYGFELYPDIANLWKERYMKETVFGCYYNTGIPGWSWENGSQLSPHSFGCDEEKHWEDGYAELTFYNEFPEGPRKDATFQKVYYKPVEGKKDEFIKLDYTQLAVAHPFYLKQRYSNYDWEKHKGLNWWGSATVPVIRYAEVLLTYAEAQAQSAGPDASAYAAINQVRKRAGLEDLTPGLAKDKFVEAVVAERGWEFAGPEPAARWFDLVRTETVAKVTAKRSPKELPISAENMPNDQTHKGYLMPIPVDK